MVATGIAVPELRAARLHRGCRLHRHDQSRDRRHRRACAAEHASLAQAARDKDRTRIFARYSLIGALSIAAGALAAGAAGPAVSLGMGRLSALQAMFYLYAALGLLGAVLYSYLPHAPRREATAPNAHALGPSRNTVYKLAALFSLDSFAGGFVVQSLLALWLFQRFDLSLAAASAFFFWSNVLTAFSYPVAAWLGQRFGLVNTMVFTHIPSSICLILAAFSSDLDGCARPAAAAIGALADGRADAHILRDGRRHARRADCAASVTAVPRSLASSLSPALAGALLSTSFAGLPLVICGVLKIVYDLSLLYSFRHIKPPEEASLLR